MDDAIKLTLEGWLECPKCGWGHSHQGKIEIFNRKEDAEDCNHVTVDGQASTIDRKIKGNPSLRRQGIKIYFECEDGCKFAICVIQHKGNTYIEYC